MIPSIVDEGAGSAGQQQEPNYLTMNRGLKSWLFTLDHKRIGVIAIMIFLFIIPAIPAALGIASVKL